MSDVWDGQTIRGWPPFQRAFASACIRGVRRYLRDVTVTAPALFAFDNSYARSLPGLYEAWQATAVAAPRLLALNVGLATELGLDADALRADHGVVVLAGGAVPSGATPIAQAYAGHQFGGYSPRLGDGRAVLIGEVVDLRGRRRDLHLKGSGPTPFARRGDGKAVVGPMLREYVIGEAMHALGVPTTRALAVVATGEMVQRERLLPGAVLTRVAASHLRVGTFQYAASLPDRPVLRRLADYAIQRHHPDAAEAANPYLALLEAVVDAQAALVAAWMHVGFVHGVMNTDNVTISGETIDYGPCAFMDAFDPATVFSSIDHGGRYAYGNQPAITQWNLARFAEALLRLIDPEIDTAVAAATAVLDSFAQRYRERWLDAMRAKLGLTQAHPGDQALAEDLLRVLAEHRVDYTTFFRALADAARGDDGPVLALFEAGEAFQRWSQRWLERLHEDCADSRAAAEAMDLVNPAYIPRNHLVEDALSAATGGDIAPFERLVDVVSRPFQIRPGLEAYASAAPPSSGAYRTFCGT